MLATTDQICRRLPTNWINSSIPPYNARRSLSVSTYYITLYISTELGYSFCILTPSVEFMIHGPWLPWQPSSGWYTLLYCAQYIIDAHFDCLDATYSILCIPTSLVTMTTLYCRNYKYGSVYLMVHVLCNWILVKFNMHSTISTRASLVTMTTLQSCH